jgi:biopolymer transport protein ExbB
MELFQKGGPVMYLLLLCSLSVLAIAIDRWLFYRRASNGAETLLQSITEAAGKGLSSVLIEGDSVTAFLLDAGKRADSSGSDVRLAVESAYGEAAMKLRARLNYLSMIVTLAPLLGLLGTISGMIDSFNIFSVAADQPLAITAGIGEALIATATGLCVAIFALVVHTVLASRMDSVLTIADRAEAAVISAAGGVSHAA